MKNYFPFLQLMILVCSFSACKDFSQIVAIEIPEHESKLAATTVIGDKDTQLRVLVSNSIGILEDRSFAAIDNAEVQLFKDGQLFQTVQAEPNSSHYIARLDDSVRSHGSLFRLEVSVPDYPLLSAEQVMPRPIPITTAEIEVGGTVDIEGYRVDELIVEFQDPASEENYYGLALEGTRQITVDGDTISGVGTLYLDSNDPSLTPMYLAPYTLVFSDAGFNGRTARISSYVYGSLRGFEGRVRLFHLTKDLYQYNRSVILYENAVDNPFAEPVTVHNNIENGYGLFGLHAVSAFEIQ